MKRLLKKQGFTMVELIVVVAIIGIMLGIVVPLMSTNSAREREARENARAFYSNVQELMIEEKLNDTPLGTGDYTLIYAVLTPDSASTIPTITVSKSNAASISGFNAAAVFDEIVSGDDLEEFAGSLKKLIQLDNDQTNPVYYYAVVDKKYRVVISYYSLDEYTEIAGKAFTSDCLVTSASGDQVWTGSYPYTESVSGVTVFHD